MHRFITEIPYERDINKTNQLICNFVKRDDVSEKNKLYIKTIFKTISRWNLGYILEETKDIDYGILFCKTNLVECMNRVIKNKIKLRKLSCNWMYIIKKIIVY